MLISLFLWEVDMASRKRTSWYGFVKRCVMDYVDKDVGAFAAEASYLFILGMIPFLIFFVNCLLFVAAPEMDTILSYLKYLPESFADPLSDNIVRIVAGRSGIWLFVGLLASVWTSSQGAGVLVRGMDMIDSGDRNVQSWFSVMGKACFFTLFLVGTMLVSLGLIVFANALIWIIHSYIFVLPDFFLSSWKWVRYVIPFVVMSFSLAAFYRWAPKKGYQNWGSIVVISFFATILLLLVTAAYGYYVLHISNMGVTYGSLIGLIFLFLWIRLALQVILFGGVLIDNWEKRK